MSETYELLLMAAVWTLIAVVIACFIKNWPGRLAFLAIAVGLPFWELPYGYYNFQNLCGTEARLLVFEKIPPQDSICLQDLDSGLYSRLANAGFTRIEVTGKSDDAKRDSQSGRVLRTQRSGVKSSYCIGFHENISLPWRVRRGDLLVTRANDTKVVARQSHFSWAGMWWQEQLRPIFGSGGTCFDNPDRVSFTLRNGV
jgi:hypothetical protein